MAVASIAWSRSAGPGTIAMSLKALAVGGHISLIGASLSSSGAGLDPLLLTGRGITLGSIRSAVIEAADQRRTTGIFEPDIRVG